MSGDPLGSTFDSQNIPFATVAALVKDGLGLSMTDTIIFLTSQAISNDEVVRAVTEMSGRWDHDPTLNRGVIQKGRATIFINAVASPSIDYSNDELANTSAQLEASPIARISIDLGHGQGSDNLARTVAEAFKQRWGGLIDFNGVK